MSTSAPTSPLGSCVVCGQRTATRCGPCAEHGTDWMFFCSREHQKLIWGAHKRVCGPLSMPFLWPGFSKKEIEANMAICDKPYYKRSSVTGHIETVTLLDLFGVDDSRNIKNPTKEDLGDPRNYFFFMLSLKEEGYPHYPRIPILSSASAAGCRSLVYSTRKDTINYARTSSQSGSYAAFIHSPIDYLASLEEELLDDFARQPYNYEPYWTKFHHLYFIFVTLLHRLALRADDESQRFVNNSRYALRRFLSDVVASTHPQVAQLFLENMISGDLAELEEWKKATWS